MLKTVSTQLALASDTLSEILAKGNTSGPSNIAMDSGYGIDFSATAGTGTSELLDDYEEGTFTVFLEDQSGNADPGTYNGRIGNYTKIGRSVHVKIYVRGSGTTTGMTTSEMLRITGLPFAVGTGQDQVPAFANLTALAPSIYLDLFGQTYTSQTYLNIFAVGGDITAPHGPTPFTIANYENGNASEIFLNFTYTTA